MSDETPRLKLPEIVSLQEMNAVTWNEILVQLDAFVDLCLSGQFVDNPPASPSDGEAYLTGGTPTGDWTGQAYKIASRLDGAWRFYTPFNGLRAYVTTTNTIIIHQNGVWSDWSALTSANEVSIASASTCDLGAAGSLFVQITGTTAITSFGSGANKLRFVRFVQGLTLTHNATSLILLGGASRTTAANDVGIYASDANGNWRERSYFRAAANPGDYATRSGTETLTNKTLGAVTLPGNGKFDSTGNLVLNSANAAAAKLDVYGKFICGTGSIRAYGDACMITGASGSQTSIFMFQSGIGSGYFGLRASDTNLYLINSYASGTMTDTAGFSLGPTGHFQPLTDNAQNLGSAAFRMATIYAGTGTINTSGRETKTAIAALGEAELAVAKKLASNICVFQFCDAVAGKGEAAARLHAGMIYEEVVAAFAAGGLDPERYAIVCRDLVMRKKAAEDGKPEEYEPDLDESGAQKWLYGLRYDELAQFVMAGLAARLAALEAK